MCSGVSPRARELFMRAILKSLQASLGRPLPSANWTWPRDIWEQTRRTLIYEECECRCHFSFCSSCLPFHQSTPLCQALVGSIFHYPSSRSRNSIQTYVLTHGDDPSYNQPFFARSVHQHRTRIVSHFLSTLPSITSRSGNTLPQHSPHETLKVARETKAKNHLWLTLTIVSVLLATLFRISGLWLIPSHQKEMCKSVRFHSISSYWIPTMCQTPKTWKNPCSEEPAVYQALRPCVFSHSVVSDSSWLHGL